MNISKFFIKEASEAHEKMFGPMNCHRLSRVSGISPATIRKQTTDEDTKVQAETFLKLLIALGSVEIDEHGCSLKIVVKKSRKNSENLAKIKNRMSKRME
jgi:hypothetical protein